MTNKAYLNLEEFSVRKEFKHKRINNMDEQTTNKPAS
jgi:hypothetical protein